jgi:hypothetical protein
MGLAVVCIAIVGRGWALLGDDRQADATIGETKRRVVLRHLGRTGDSRFSRMIVNSSFV